MSWAYIMRLTPMMSNPFEYRERLWSILHDGDIPPPVVERAPSDKRPALPRGTGRGITKADQEQLDAFQAEILEIQRRRQEPPATPAAS